MSQSKPQRPPRRHHFIPEFLLRQWTGSDGLLQRYRRRGDGSIGHRRASPKAVGFEDGLYETVGFPPEHSQQMEQKFMGPLDDRAAKAHRLLADGRGNDMTDAMACDWARFIMSIWFRTPIDTNGLRAAIAAVADPAIGERVIGMPVPDGFPDEAYEQIVMEAMRIAIDDPDRGRALINMQWGHVDLTPPRSFMISDWPLDSAKDLPFLGHPGSYLTIPLTPNRLFVAAPSRTFLARLADLPERELERRHNYAVVSQARNFVGAQRAGATKFIKRNFGVEQRPSIARVIAGAWQISI